MIGGVREVQIKSTGFQKRYRATWTADSREGR